MNPRLLSLTFVAVLPTTLLFVFLRFTQEAASQVANESILISEVAWAGTAHSSADEWIELHNAGDTPVDLTGWRLTDSSGDVDVALQGIIGPGDFFLLERTADDTVSDIAADQIYVGSLHNDGETLTLTDGDGTVISSANAPGGEWPAGEASPSYISMERTSPAAPDDMTGWAGNNGTTTNGTDAGGNAINGTPRSPNSTWSGDGGNGSDLVVTLDAPSTSVAGALLVYQVDLANTGAELAGDVSLTLTLPVAVTYLGDDSGLEADLTSPNQAVWAVEALNPGASENFVVTTTLALTATGTVTSTLLVAASTLEDDYTNNWDEAATSILLASQGELLIGALLYDGYELNDGDEAVQLVNMADHELELGGWSLGNGDRVTMLDPLTIEAGDTSWLARDADAFARQFGIAPDAVVAPWPGFANAGGVVILRDAQGQIVDSLLYKNGAPGAAGWSGPAVWPYRVTGLFAEEGQLLFRRRDETSGFPVADHDRAEDWAQAMANPLLGRKVQYPGWNLERFFQPVTVTGTHTLTISVAPDNAFETVIHEIERAQHTIWLETLTLENLRVGDALAAAAQRGVDVSILLEGAPAGGIADQQRYICQRLEASGAQCWFMIRDDTMRIHDRYRYIHAKFMIVDQTRALISSENLSPNSLPYDDKADGTWGRRGLVVTVSAVPLVSRLVDLFNDDLAPQEHADLFRWHENHPLYGPPPDTFVPVTTTGGTTYTVRYPQPIAFSDVTHLSVYHAPEDLLRSSDGLFALLSTAGAGDFVLVQQLSERVHWGASTSNPQDDPNPRLEAYIDAARRGATLRVMLDSFFDSPADALSNATTCDYLRQVAISEHLRITCVLANPTGMGIHNKMVLLRIDGHGWVHTGSWNGTEQSAKGNRELAVLAQSDAAYGFLASLFESDWPHQNWLPLTINDYRGPASYPLIGEIFYDPAGEDDPEFIELNNPTSALIDLSNWTLGDAVLVDDFEDVRRFPAGTILHGHSTLVVALSGARFEERFGFLPDLELLDSHADVADMLDDPLWGEPTAHLQLGNGGDEVLLRSPSGLVVDVVTYGAGSFPGITGCSLLEASGQVLERVPYWLDSDDCSHDFRSWPLPSPGALP